MPPPPIAPTGPGTPSAYYGALPGPAPYAQPGYGYPYGQPGYPTLGAYPGQPGAYAVPGAYPGQPYGWQGPGHLPSNGQGTAALVLGIVGAALFFTLVGGVVCGVLAIIFGLLGRGRANRGEATNGGQALAGVILGALAVVASLITLLAIVADARDDEDDDQARGAERPAVVLVVPGGEGSAASR
ncbi:hypothetical protein E4099_31020 [Streptomyces palmae]|uniref:DUF4190 domain-containing protein n=1 Tax=Streptomyces palmae TaxID=1701085 RepID=A0A4Z0FU45_9ACTN|nr:hypothetical protein E4099_31020 [Streptomyces palmae]